jgi:hypothetical protein
MTILLNEFIIKDFSYTKESRAIFNSKFRIQTFKDVLLTFQELKYRDDTRIKHVTRFNSELNIFYIIREYLHYFKRYGSEKYSTLGFELYKDYKVYDIIVPYRGTYFLSSYGLGSDKDEITFFWLFNSMRERRKGLI